MRLGLSQVSRKLRRKFKTNEGNSCKKEAIFFFDKDGKIIAKEGEGQIIQVFAETEDGEIRLLVLVKGLKRKVDQNLSIISAALVFRYESGSFLRYVKNRGFCYERDESLEKTDIKPIIEIKEMKNGLFVKSDDLGITETITEVGHLEDAHPFYVITEKTKLLKGEKEE